MKKTHKAVLRSSLVMLVLFAVAGSGVAQAQVCDARSTSNAVRAEGITEVVADLRVRCRVEGVFGLDVADEANITVQLNTNITNIIDMEERLVTVKRVMMSLEDLAGTDADEANDALAAGQIVLFVSDQADVNDDEMAFNEVTLSDDGTTLTWELTAAQANLAGTTANQGFNFTISGIRANAASLGDGQDVTASVLVAGVSPANTSGPVKLAAVKTGLVIPVKAATGDQCEDTEATATVTIKEGAGVLSAINDGSRFVITFRGIPEGVTVTVPLSVDSMDMPPMGEGDDLVAAVTDTFGIELLPGIASGTDGDGVVDLSAAGAGEVVYMVQPNAVTDAVEDAAYTTDATESAVKDEWVTLEVTFEWESADLMPANAMGTVNVSFDPVSAVLGDSFDDLRGALVPRFIASDNTQDVLDISLCTTTLLFPFVTNQAGFDTGIAITNTSEEAGSCSISYHGGDGGDVWMTPEVAEEDHTVFLASATTPGFQGYIMATCGFRDAHGYAFITNGASTLAQGYLAVCTSCDDD